MKLILIALSGFLAITWAYADNKPRILDLNAFTISPNISQETEIAKSAFNQHKRLIEALDVPIEISLREKRYTAEWNVIEESAYLPPSSDLIAQMSAVRKVQNRDDGIFLSYESTSGDWWVKLIDARRLEYMVFDKSFSGLGIQTIFRKAVIQFTTSNVQVLQDHVIDHARSYGTIIRSVQTSKGEWRDNIEWYRDSNTVLFVFSKQRPMPDTKMPITDPSKVVGGIPSTDARDYLRFERSNRVQLSIEYVNSLQKLNSNAAKPLPEYNSSVIKSQVAHP